VKKYEETREICFIHTEADWP